MSGILENFFRGGVAGCLHGVCRGVKKDRRAAWLTVWGVGCLCVWGMVFYFRGG